MLQRNRAQDAVAQNLKFTFMDLTSALNANAPLMIVVQVK